MEGEIKMEITVDTSKIRIETKRLVLRGFRADDLSDFYDYAKVEGVGECAGWSHHKSIEESREILSKFIEDKNVFAVVDKGSGKVIGSVGIKDPDEATVSRFPDVKVKEIGYVLAKDYWGKGLMTEAAQAVVCYCFDELNLDAVSARYFVGNDRSRRVIEKCGFEYFADTEFHSASLGTDYRCMDYILRNKRKNIG